MFVIVIREKGADEASEVIGPFNTQVEADKWVKAFAEEDSWYDIHETTKPDIADTDGRVWPIRIRNTNT